MTVKCEVCGRDYEVSDTLYKLIGEGLESLCGFCDESHDPRDPAEPPDYNEDDPREDR